MTTLKRWPWMSREDADLIAQWHTTDPGAALEYERYLYTEHYSDQKFHSHSVSLDALTESGTVELGYDWLPQLSNFEQIREVVR